MLIRTLIVFVSLLLLIACQAEQDKTAQTPEPKPQATQPAEPEPEPAPPEPAPEPTQPEEPVFPGYAGNRPPVLTGAKILPTDTGGMKIEVGTADEDGDEVTLSYAWFINDQMVSSGNSVPSVKKGDHVHVTITPNDGTTDGKSDTIATIVTNTPPVVQKNEELQINPEGKLTYQIKANDVDGDALKFTLVEAPAGMKIDEATGLVTWETAKVEDGNYKAIAEVSDGTTPARYTFQVNLSKESKN